MPPRYSLCRWRGDVALRQPLLHPLSITSHLPNSVTFRPASELWLAAMALLLLGAGAAVYLLDRTPGTAMLLPAAWQRAAAGLAGGAWFGRIGDWLPSFVHAFSFSIFTALLLQRSFGAEAGACAGWALVDTLAEIGQHPAISPVIAAWLEQTFGTCALSSAVARYFVRGGFDLADVWAGLAGAGLALVALVVWRRAGVGVSADAPRQKLSSVEMS
jgi:hypothetical protein